MSRNVSFCFSLVSQSGCKTTTYFFTHKKNLKFFFRFIYRNLTPFLLSISQITLRVLRGANVNRFFKSHKLFSNFFFKLSSESFFLACQYLIERFRCCGCKSRTFIRLNKTFLKLFLVYFLIN